MIDGRVLQSAQKCFEKSRNNENGGKDFFSQWVRRKQFLITVFSCTFVHAQLFWD